MAELPLVTIYTDGACEPNPGPGGWAALLLFGRHEKVLRGADSETTNNRMELTAAVEALRALSQPAGWTSIPIPSTCVGHHGMAADWRRRGWKRKGGKLANIDLQGPASLEGHESAGIGARACR
jgi:ribonuclease HI